VVNSIDTDIFLAHFRKIFIETDPSIIGWNTSFRDLQEWSSLTALLLISTINAEYKVSITNEDIKRCVIVKDIFQEISYKLDSA
jgi:acyl carrier protein